MPTFFYHPFLLFLLIGSLVLSLPSYAALYTTVASGNWNIAANWDLGVVPNSGDDILVAGHSMTLTSNTSVQNATIAPGGIIDGSGLYFFRIGLNLTHYGTIKSCFSLFILRKGTIMDGVGSIIGGGTYFMFGNKTNEPTANLSWSGAQCFVIPTVGTCHQIEITDAEIIIKSADIEISRILKVAGSAQFDIGPAKVFLAGNWNNVSMNPAPFLEGTCTV